MNFSPLAKELLEKRYLLEDESPEEMFRRVAGFVAEAESSNRIKQEEKFYKLLSSLDFLPNSPCLMNAGTKSPQLAACFVYPVDDDMESIFDTLKHTAITHKTGGGTGFSFSRLRPRGDKVKSTGGETTGPVSFMEVYDKATAAVMQGGKRRGANMGMLRVDHPDIEEFITAKTEEDKLNNFNISVAVTDEFMEALEKDEEYNLYWPPGGKPRGKKKAKDIFEKIARGGWKNGEPGVIFIDRVNETNPLKELGDIEATNPCVPALTWVMTEAGPRQVKELIGKKIRLAADGDIHPSSDKGFFSSGIKKTVKILTAEGFEIEATPKHLIRAVTKVTRDKLYGEWKEAGKLKKGDLISLNRPNHFSWPGRYNEKEGYLVGSFMGDGTLKPDRALLMSWGESNGEKKVRKALQRYAESFKHRSDFAGWYPVSGRGEYRMAVLRLKKVIEELGIGKKKVITDKLEKASSDFYRGFLRGFFDTDGSVQGNRAKGVSVRLAQSDPARLKAVQRMLLRLGIYSKIYADRKGWGRESKLPDGKGSHKIYKIKAQHELVISRENMRVFMDRIGFTNSDKEKKIKNLLAGYKRKLNKERFTATVESVVSAGKKEVYDVTVPGENAFSANGFYVHNCGEQPLLPYESCILGSINLANHVKDGEINWDKLKETARSGVEFLDDAIDVSAFPLKEITDIVKSNRKIGLGVMGFAAMLMKLDLSYNSQEAIEIARRVMKFIQESAHQRSEELAGEKGEFANYFKSDIDTPRRNALVTTIAPTGSISILAGTTSGIEPLFSLVTERQSPSGENVVMAEPLFIERLKKEGLDADKIVKKIREGKKLAGLEDVPDKVKEVFTTALGIPPEVHVLMQAAFQKHVDNAISKTVNLPEHFPLEGVKDIITKAYRAGCKGITVYRHNARKQQVLNIVCECDNPGLDD